MPSTYLRGFRFEKSELEYLATLNRRDNRPLFESAFLDFLHELRFTCDAIYDIARPLAGPVVIADPLDTIRRKHIPAEAANEDLISPVPLNRELVQKLRKLDSTRDSVQRQLAQLSSGSKRLENPYQYPAGLELGLHELKDRIDLQARGES